MAKTREPSLKDVVRLGLDVARAKANTKPKEWAAIVKAAHARGVTVGGALGGGPPELQARTQASLKAQAEKLTASTYAPAYADLDSQEKKVNGLAAKRQADNAAYREWLTGQTDKLQADARAADAALASRLEAIHTDTQNAWQDTAAQAHANAAAAAGTVSDTSQSKALAGLGAAAAHSNEVQGASHAAAVNQSAGAVAQMSVAGTALLGQQAVNETKRVSDQNEGLAKVADARTQYKLKQAADAATGFNDLLTQQATLASAAQDRGIAADKLGVEQDKLDYTKLKDTRDYGLATKKFDLDTFVAQNQVLTDQAKTQLGYDQIAASQGKSAADAALTKWVTRYNKAHPQAQPPADATAPTAAEQTQSQNLYRSANTIKGQIIDLHKKPPKHSSIRQVLRSRGYDDTMIDIAEDLRVHNGKLSQAGRSKARNAGILHPEQLWPQA